MKYVMYFYISTFRSMRAQPNMAVFCTSLISCFPGMLVRHCVNDFEMVPVASVITGITFTFTFHMRWIFIMRSLYSKIFSVSYSITFLCPGIATSINMHVPLLLKWIMMSSFLLGIVLSVHTCWFHNMVTIHSWLFSTDFGTWSYQHYYCCCCCCRNVYQLYVQIYLLQKYWRLLNGTFLPHFHYISDSSLKCRAVWNRKELQREHTLTYFTNEILSQYNKRLGQFFGHGMIFCFLKLFHSTANYLLEQSSQISTNIWSTIVVLPSAQVWKMQIQISTVLVQEYNTHHKTRVFIVTYYIVFVMLLLQLFGGGGVFIIIIIISEYKLQSKKEHF